MIPTRLICLGEGPTDSIPWLRLHTVRDPFEKGQRVEAFIWIHERLLRRRAGCSMREILPKVNFLVKSSVSPSLGKEFIGTCRKVSYQCISQVRVGDLRDTRIGSRLVSAKGAVR
jgi:hypothetical protein